MVVHKESPKRREGFAQMRTPVDGEEDVNDCGRLKASYFFLLV